MNRLVNIRNQINFKSKKGKIYIAIIVAVFVILVINYIIKKRRWDRANPIFFSDSIPADTRAIVPSRKIKNSINKGHFTYMIWIYVEDLKYRYGVHKNIFTKGNIGYYSESQSPGMYISPKRNSIEIVLSTMANNQIINEKMILDDFPMKKWFSVAVVAHEKSVAVFLNGELSISKPFSGDIIENTGNIVIGGNGGFIKGETEIGSNLNLMCKKAGYNKSGEGQGFSGKISSLCYFPESKQPKFIKLKHAKGPYSRALYTKIYKYFLHMIPGFRKKVENEEGDESEEKG